MATYYVSSVSGNDSNDGLSSGNAWATLSKLDAEIASGDIALLERGSLFREGGYSLSSGTSGNLTTVDAYGSGDKPIISGYDLITSWTNFSGNIWYASVASEVFWLKADGVRVPDSRFPKTGYISNMEDVDATQTIITDTVNLTQAR